MRKALHEEVSKEITDKSVHIAVKMAKPVLDDYSAKQIKKSSVEKTSVMEKLKKFKEIVSAIPKKVAEKKKERSR